MEFLEMIPKLNDEALYSDFALALEYKWVKDKKYVMLISIMYLIYVLIIDYHVIFQKNQSVSPMLKTILLLCVFLLSSYEVA